jgi:hypothetical protein
MNERDFFYWLRGFFELDDLQRADSPYPQKLSVDQVKLIRQHMNLVVEQKTSGKKWQIDPNIDCHLTC